VSFTHERPLAPVAGLPEPPGYGTSQHRFEIAVIFTSFDATTAALKMAGTLVKGLSANVKLVVPQVVPYPLPLDSPPVLREFCERRLRDITNECPVDTTVLVYLCRNRLATLRAVLKRGSIVVIGGWRRWWPTPEKSLARNMRRSGYEVIFTEMD
jgi:hypothetical protein